MEGRTDSKTCHNFVFVPFLKEMVNTTTRHWKSLIPLPNLKHQSARHLHEVYWHSNRLDYKKSAPSTDAFDLADGGGRHVFGGEKPEEERFDVIGWGNEIYARELEQRHGNICVPSTMKFLSWMLLRNVSGRKTTFTHCDIILEVN